jgi:hypothetical protein
MSHTVDVIFLIMYGFSKNKRQQAIQNPAWKDSFAAFTGSYSCPEQLIHTTRTYDGFSTFQSHFIYFK